MVLGALAMGVVVYLAKIPLTYPVAAQHKLPLLLPLYLAAPAAVELHRRLTVSTWGDYGIAWRQPFWSLGLAGFVVAAAGVGALVGLQVGLGWRRWQGLRPVAEADDTGAAAPLPARELPERELAQGDLAPGLAILLVLLVALFVGWIEELVFRGVLVNGLAAAMPILPMAIAVCAIFAVSHLAWDGPAGAPQLPGLALMGAVLLLGRWAAGGSLALAWGLHAGWVFAIAAIDALALLQPGQSEPGWLVGLFDQPLTGVLPLALLALTGVGVWLWGGLG